MLVGSNSLKTKKVDIAHKNFVIDVQQTLYIDQSDTKITIIAQTDDRNNNGISDKGVGELLLDAIGSEQTSVSLLTTYGRHFGDIAIKALTKKVPKR
jgi:hypothetical protein